MINKARRKFIISAMVAMIVLVVVLVSAVNVVNWSQTNNRLEAALQEIADYNDSGMEMAGIDAWEQALPGGWPPGDEIFFGDAPDGELPFGPFLPPDSDGSSSGEEMTMTVSLENDFETSIQEGNEDTSRDVPENTAFPENDESLNNEDVFDKETREPNDKNGTSKGKQSADDSRPEKEAFKSSRARASALTQYGSRYFIALLDTENQVDRVIQQQELVADDYVQELVDNLPVNLPESGNINDYKYCLMEAKRDGIAICFLDCSTDYKAMRSLLLISIIVGVIGIILAFLFILRMSRIAVEPVRISIEKQKQFITNAGHELKTPLTSIATNMDILTMDLGKNEWVDGTKKQVGKLRRLVENLVSLSKLEEDERVLEMMDFSLSDTVHECVESFEGVAQMNGKELQADITDGLNIQGDPGTIQQLVSILCDNAIKYSSGDGSIQVRLYPDGKNICLETSNEWEQNVDDGHIEDLFERFYRGDPARSQENKSSGHGLGLSIAQAIAHKNNAKLSVSTTGDGRIQFKVIFKRIPCTC